MPGATYLRTYQQSPGCLTRGEPAERAAAQTCATRIERATRAAAQTCATRIERATRAAAPTCATREPAAASKSTSPRLNKRTFTSPCITVANIKIRVHEPGDGNFRTSTSTSFAPPDLSRAERLGARGGAHAPDSRDRPRRHPHVSRSSQPAPNAGLCGRSILEVSPLLRRSTPSTNPCHFCDCTQNRARKRDCVKAKIALPRERTAIEGSHETDGMAWAGRFRCTRAAHGLCRAGLQ